MHQLIGTGTGDPKHCGDFCHGEHQRKLSIACVPTYPTHWSHGLQHLRHKRPTFALTGKSGYTLGFRRRIAHKRLHAETRAFRAGPLSLPSDCFTRFGNPAWPGFKTANFAAFGAWPGCSRRTQRAFGTAMRLCASLSRGVAAPLGCVICLQLGDVAVFSLCAQYFLNVRGGGGITTLGAFHTFRKPCVAGYQNGVLCRFWVLVGGTPEGHREPAEQRCALMRVAVPKASRPRWAA